MADPTDATVEPDEAASSVGLDDFRLDPRNVDGDAQAPPPIWPESQRLREVIEKRQPRPDKDTRVLLSAAVTRQLRTLKLYRAVIPLAAEPHDRRKPEAISLYVLLFPGEARDNTGIKDLNDKILGPKRNDTYITARQKAIDKIFSPTAGGQAPYFQTVGQDYKTAYILAVQKTPKDFAKELVRLDAELRTALIAVLADAEKDKENHKPENTKRLDAIRKLKRTLEKNPKYRFDFLFGLRTHPASGRAQDVTFELLTEALKAAGIARFALRQARIGRSTVTDKIKDRGIPRTPKGWDDRGQAYDGTLFLRVANTVDVLKKILTSRFDRDFPYEMYQIYVATVWTVTFFPYRKRFWGNPDVIREVRKKNMPSPPLRDGISFTHGAQVALLELWLVTLNMIDFISDITSSEYQGSALHYHDTSLAALAQVEDATEPELDWDRLTKVLTRDHRQGPDPFAQLGTTSEFRFYAYSSDHRERIFFAFDIRDLGVELMLFYEDANIEITELELQGNALLRETLKASDSTIYRKRFTHDILLEVFQGYYELVRRRGARSQAERAFGGLIHTDDPMPAFSDSLQILLGGDELFIAAHPYYTPHIGDIIADLDHIEFNGLPINLRAGVAFSAAEAVRAGRRAPESGPAISPEQRLRNQLAHNEALRLAADGGNILKPYEQAQRRIERLIDMLEANPKKADRALPMRTRLVQLGLTQLYVRHGFGKAGRLPADRFARIEQLMRDGDPLAAAKEGNFELVNFIKGTVVDRVELLKQAEDLEDQIRKMVGFDNFRASPPPVTKEPTIPPKWKKLIDLIRGPKDPKTA